MIKTAFLISTVCVLSSFARPQIQQQQQNIQTENELPEIQKKDIQISKFHVNTSIQMRYGIQYTIIVKWVIDFLTHGYKIISEFIGFFCELTRYILSKIIFGGHSQKTSAIERGKGQNLKMDRCP